MIKKEIKNTAICSCSIKMSQLLFAPTYDTSLENLN